MGITRVSIIGLGALGILFGNQLLKQMPKENLKIIADHGRINKYQHQGVYCNGERCSFNYIAPETTSAPADLLIFAVKFNDLHDAIAKVKNHVGNNTIILSLLNGITSEGIISQTYGMERVLYCVAQGMDAVKVGNRLTYEHMGKLFIGDLKSGIISEQTRILGNFFNRTSIPYEIDINMPKRMWGKLMLNVGVNQTVAVCEGTYGDIQMEGSARDTLISAMREVIALSATEGIDLTEDDLNYWLGVLGTLSPEGKPSMRQDLEAKRYSEVELFAGTVLALGKKHGIPTPTNQVLYDRIKAIESRY